MASGTSWSSATTNRPQVSLFEYNSIEMDPPPLSLGAVYSQIELGFAASESGASERARRTKSCTGLPNTMSLISVLGSNNASSENL